MQESVNGSMTALKIAPLVTSRWLKENVLDSSQSTTKLIYSHRVLDTSWGPEPDVDSYTQYYTQSHIPTALYFDLKKLSLTSEESTAKFSIPDSTVFKEYVENLGINNSTHVIIYDRFNSSSSFKTWFLFRLFGHDNVSVLNGGLKQWLKDEFLVTTEEPVFEKQVFSINFRSYLLRDYTSILKNIDIKIEQLIDARPQSSFYPPDKESTGGHIPGAKNIPFGTLFNEDGIFKSEQDLTKLFTEAGVDLNRPLISSCQTGMTACGLLMAAYILGKQNVPLYNGSFIEWSKLADANKIVKTYE